MKQSSNQEVPIQPVEDPILSSPYEEPLEHWTYKQDTGEAMRTPGRRQAGYYYKTKRAQSAQLSFFAEETFEELPLVNRLRESVRRWRGRDYEGATPVTRKLLAHWARKDRARRLFFCQLEAVETIIYLHEILESGKRPTWKDGLEHEDFRRLCRGERASFVAQEDRFVYPRLSDLPNEPGMEALRRYACKMATGSGKTVVMAMLLAWAFCNRARRDERFPSAALILCPNLTIYERLQVLRPDAPDNYFDRFDIVPSQYREDLHQGKVLILNWQKLAPESPHKEGDASYAVVNKGDESPDAFARRILGELYERAPIMVLNDEGHHAYRPKPLEEGHGLTAEEKKEREDATVWVSGLDRIQQGCGIRFVVDMSATPFYLSGSGHTEGSPFPWVVSDFGIVDAIESGIVKIPRIPVSDDTGRPDPKYFRLWRSITDDLAQGERLTSGRPKPAVVWLKGEDALATLASQYKQKFEQVQNAKPGQAIVPPAMIVICDNTDIAEEFYRNISGEETVEVEVAGRGGKIKTEKKTSYGTGKTFPEIFSNTAGSKPTLRIDSKLLAEAESDDPNKSKSAAAEELRHVVDTVGKVGQPGEQVRCIVSVQMLTEGWDASNVTHILGLRAFESQLLCEQVVGRGLRRMDYDPDPETGRLIPEYVDVYGIPFSIIPFQGIRKKSPPPPPPPNHVKPLDERGHMEMRFPIVEGFAVALERNLITADIGAIEPLVLEPMETPTAVFVKPQVGYQFGHPSLGGFEAIEETREAYYSETHLQTIEFEIARQIVWNLTEGTGAGDAKLRLRSRHQLFPQVYRIVNEYVERKINWNGCDQRELGLQTYVQRTVERLTEAIRPDESQGEPPLLPILNRSKQIGSTAEVSFKTTRPCYPTQASHLNQVVMDTQTWERCAAFRIESAALKGIVKFYARNDHLELTIPYEYSGVPHSYSPDFVVRLANGVSLLLEIKGLEDEQVRAKHEAAKRWVAAVNNWGKLGRWAFHVCHSPQTLGNELAYLSRNG